MTLKALTIWSCLAALPLAGCGIADYTALIQGTGTSGKSADATQTERLHRLTGHIEDLHGNSLAGWKIFLSPNDKSGGRFAEVDEDGSFSVDRFDPRKFWTINVFDSDSVMRAVTSIENNRPATISQYFSTHSDRLPLLILDGPVVKFRSLIGLSVGRELASDTNSDGIPDGMVGTTVAQLSNFGQDATGISLTSNQDSDLDGIINDLDIDIDGDGVINLFDPDDDGDAVLDIFDLDADTNLIADDQDPNYGSFENDRAIKRAYASFKSNVVSPALALTESMNAISLKLETNSLGVQDGSNLRVTILGSHSLLSDAMVFEDGQWTAFDRTLQFTEQSDETGGKFFERTVFFSGEHHFPNRNTFFFHVEDLNGAIIGDYPFAFSVEPSESPSLQYDSPSRTVLLVGNPFSTQDFTWAVSVNNNAGIPSYISPSMGGAMRTFAIPDDVSTAGMHLSVQARSLAKIPGNPMYDLSSKSFVPQ